MELKLGKQTHKYTTWCKKSHFPLGLA